MNKQEQIMAYCRQFRTTGIANELMDMIRTAEQQSTGYLEFTLNLLRAEAEHRQKNATQRRRKAAQLPTICHLKHYDFSFDKWPLQIQDQSTAGVKLVRSGLQSHVHGTFRHSQNFPRRRTVLRCRRKWI